jgi:hypothetical protein
MSWSNLGIWDAGVVKVDMMDCSDQIIHVRVIMLDTNTCLNTSIVYGDNSPSIDETVIVRHNDS